APARARHPEGRGHRRRAGSGGLLAVRRGARLRSLDGRAASILTLSPPRRRSGCLPPRGVQNATTKPRSSTKDTKKTTGFLLRRRRSGCLPPRGVQNATTKPRSSTKITKKTTAFFFVLFRVFVSSW